MENRKLSALFAEGKVVSLQVGKPRKLTTEAGTSWRSAIAKVPVLGPVALDFENLEGDYQANRKYHGGPDKAICIFSVEHLPHLSEQTGTSLTCGAFGENLTISDLTEALLCIGDTLQVGTVLLQISQPRQPCASISKRWSIPQLPRLMVETGSTGCYCRVLQTGEIASDDRITVIARPHPEWTISRANQVMYDKSSTQEDREALANLESLSVEWKGLLLRK